MLPSISQTMETISPKQSSFSRGMYAPQQKPQLRRIWVKKNNHTATTIMIGPYDIVDDLKYMISQKFPTTLALEYDPSDLVIKMVLNQDTTSNNANSTVNESALSWFPVPKKPFEDSYSPLSSGGSKLSNNMLSHSQSLRSNTPISPEPMLHVRSGLLLEQNSSINTVINNNTNNTNTINNNANANNTNTVPSSFTGDLGANNNSNNNTFSSEMTSKTLVLEPDILVWSILDKYFPDGMSMSDALIIDQPDKLNEDLLKRSRRIKNNFNHAPSHIKGPSVDRAELSSIDMGRSNSFSNTPHNNSVSLSKVAILGDQKVPPPRLKSLNSDSPISAPQSSAVILFSKDVRDSSKSPVYQVDNVPPPPPSPKIEDSSIVPLPVSRKQSTRSVDSLKKGNLRLNTEPGSIDKPAEPEKLPNDNNFSASTSTPNTNSMNIPKITPNNVPIQLNTPSTSTNIKSFSTKSQKADKPKDKKKYDMPKILTHINVLVVEDNLVNQKIMARHLKSCNVQFKIASTGKEALEIWKLGGFHLCFMDIQLPFMSGIEVTKEIRRLERLNDIGGNSDENNSYHNHNHGSHSNHSHVINNDDILDLTLFRSPIIIVALTASTGASDQQDALAAGCNDYLTKPVQLKWLKNKLTEWGYMQALINYDYFKSEDSLTD